MSLIPLQWRQNPKNIIRAVVVGTRVGVFSWSVINQWLNYSLFPVMSSVNHFFYSPWNQKTNKQTIQKNNSRLQRKTCLLANDSVTKTSTNTFLILTSLLLSSNVCVLSVEKNSVQVWFLIIFSLLNKKLCSCFLYNIHARRYTGAKAAPVKNLPGSSSAPPRNVFIYTLNKFETFFFQVHN